MSSSPTIVLHMPPRGPQAPNLSPFPVKLETYLRMAKIPYTCEFGLKRSPKGKFPWITYNGTVMSDSQFIINYINDKLGIDLNKHLTEEQKAYGHALQRMAEENLYWTTALMRWKFHEREWLTGVVGVPKIVAFFVARGVQKATFAQGIGRHSYEEIVQIMDQDLNALSAALGTKPFFFGDQASQYDAAIFGQLTQIVYQGSNSPGIKMCREKYRNLCDYCERMKKTYWWDWDECITHDGKKKATK